MAVDEEPEEPGPHDDNVEGDPDSLAKGMALQRALVQLSRIQNIVPNFHTVKVELTTLIKHHGLGKEEPQEQDEPAPALIEGVMPSGKYSEEIENAAPVQPDSHDEHVHSPNHGQIHTSPLPSAEVTRLQSAEITRLKSAEEIEEAEGQALVMVAMPASAFLSTIGGKSVGTVMEQKKEELHRLHEEERQQKKEASRIRRLLEAKEESQDGIEIPGLPEQPPQMKKRDSLLQLTDDQQKQLRALRLCVSRTVKGVRDNKSMRWGEPDLLTVKTLIDEIKFALVHVSEPSTVVPKLVQYICTFGSDWDDLVRKVKLSRDNLHAWADQAVWQNEVEALSPAVANMEVPLEWIDPMLLKQWEEMQRKKAEAAKKIDLDEEENRELHLQEKRIRRLRVKQALINAVRNGRLNQVLQGIKMNPQRLGTPSSSSRRRMSNVPYFEAPVRSDRERRRSSTVGQHRTPKRDSISFGTVGYVSKVVAKGRTYKR